MYEHEVLVTGPTETLDRRPLEGTDKGIRGVRRVADKEAYPARLVA